MGARSGGGVDVPRCIARIGPIISLRSGFPIGADRAERSSRRHCPSQCDRGRIPCPTCGNLRSGSNLARSSRSRHVRAFDITRLLAQLARLTRDINLEGYFIRFTAARAAIFDEYSTSTTTILDLQRDRSASGCPDCARIACPAPGRAPHVALARDAGAARKPCAAMTSIRSSECRFDWRPRWSSVRQSPASNVGLRRPYSCRPGASWHTPKLGVRAEFHRGLAITKATPPKARPRDRIILGWSK